MLLAVLISCSEGNILIERFNGVPAEERSHWRSFLVKSGADSLKGARNEELFVASHKSVYVVYTVIGDVYLYVVGKDEYDELASSCTVGNSSASRIRPSQQTQMPKFKNLLVPLRPDAVLDDHRNPNGYMEVCCRSTLLLHVVQ
ncbi:hypothetical protein OIU78_001907 [Salix suchowensis]|nr:hypothetical protein OIU78_001907 [Salix suchowensis]